MFVVEKCQDLGRNWGVTQDKILKQNSKLHLDRNTRKKSKSVLCVVGSGHESALCNLLLF